MGVVSSTNFEGRGGKVGKEKEEKKRMPQPPMAKLTAKTSTWIWNTLFRRGERAKQVRKMKTILGWKTDATRTLKRN